MLRLTACPFNCRHRRRVICGQARVSLFHDMTKPIVCDLSQSYLERLVRLIIELCIDYSTLGRLSVQLLQPLPQDQEHVDQDEAEADYESKPVSKRRRLLIKHGVEVPTYDVIRGEINAYLQVKADDDIDDDPLILWIKAQ